MRWRVDVSVVISRREVGLRKVGCAYMKPAPPVIMIFFTSGRGSNFVEPVRIGAFFQTPKSSKKGVSPFEAAVRSAEFRNLARRAGIDREGDWRTYRRESLCMWLDSC